MNPRAEWLNFERTAVYYFDDRGVRHLALPGGPRLEGMEIGDWNPIGIPVPPSITRHQAFAVMRQIIRPSGVSMLTEVESMLNALAQQASVLPETDPLRREADLNLLAFNTAGEFERNSTLMARISQVMSLDSGQVDRLFIAASRVAR